jgi:hypothetical protein
MEASECYTRTAGRMSANSPLHCCNCLPCVQTDVQSNIALQEEDSIHLPVQSNPSNSLSELL